jgi:predicted membrane protein
MLIIILAAHSKIQLALLMSFAIFDNWCYQLSPAQRLLAWRLVFCASLALVIMLEDTNKSD